MEKDYLKILKELSNNSYSPYSKFQVAAILQIKDDIIIKGVNLENVAYGETICAERVALMQAYTQGFTKEDLIAIHLYTKTGITPWGSCRQVMSELLTANCQVYIYNETEIVGTYKNEQLLPNRFKSIN
ncbi:cytidine deaminase [Spiroplasma endosymbiont of Eupeodes luniger]|uniref:cytidine deaminase n=1 Tax=Spiroplasma endosymbiont of Eupeodes luniger TaxID=3066300 RepID=UPI0030D5510C